MRRNASAATGGGWGFLAVGLALGVMIGYPYGSREGVQSEKDRVAVEQKQQQESRDRVRQQIEQAREERIRLENSRSSRNAKPV